MITEGSRIFFSHAHGPSHSNGMARAHWLPRAEKNKIIKFKDPLHGTRSTCLLLCVCVCVFVCVRVHGLVYVGISKEDGSLYCTFDGACPLTLP
jgi:hypothetical protein